MLTVTSNARPFLFYILGAEVPEAEVKLKWSDETVAVISLDPAAVVVGDPYDPAQGSRSLISGAIRPLAEGSSTITATLVDVHNDDAVLGTAEDTITVVAPGEGVPEWAGTFFGGTLPLAPSKKSSNEEHHGKPHKGHK
jgi:hypothetical protein